MDTPARSWARAKGAGAHGLRRGAWHLVVGQAHANIVVLSVRKRNVPVPRSMLDISSEPPSKWSLVQWQGSQRGARRASQGKLGLSYLVCPACSARAALEPPPGHELTCVQCRGTFPVDWERPC